MLKINEKPKKSPICPHCEKDPGMINAERIKSTFGVRFIYFCDNCRKILGVSHRKGFFMG
jgi:protein-arginine kinase activator protein McsA